MDYDPENSFIRIIYSSTSTNSSKPANFKAILQQSIAFVSNGEGNIIIFELVSNEDNDLSQNVYALSAAPVHATPESSFEDGLERCEAFIRTPDDKSVSSTIFFHEQDGTPRNDSGSSQRAYTVVLSKLGGALSETHLLPSKDKQQPKETSLDLDTTKETTREWALRFWQHWGFQRSQPHTYESLPGAVKAKSSGSRRRCFVVTWILVFAVSLVAFLSFVAIIRGKRDNTYIRYDTSGSSGPRHQLRIYWQNASEWAKANPQDTGKWKVRIDDQAIIPAELYDEDEDRYQQWYRTRYPEAWQVVEDLNYVRPAWLGSLDMTVPWDHQFHFAHCVLALRRYWKAKESGKHVCGRDIDYAHINHCLESLEKKAFVDGPREEMDPPEVMYWQTRVCF